MLYYIMMLSIQHYRFYVLTNNIRNKLKQFRNKSIHDRYHRIIINVVLRLFYRVGPKHILFIWLLLGFWCSNMSKITLITILNVSKARSNTKQVEHSLAKTNWRKCNHQNLEQQLVLNGKKERIDSFLQVSVRST